MRKITPPAGARAVLDALHVRGFEAYAVGGCVRDSLLGLAPHDWDICTAALPEQVRDAALALGWRVVETGLKHGTVTIILPDGAYEVTTFRVDGTYSDNRRPDSVRFVDSLREDLARRDFTVNAMAWDRERGVVDFFGGQADLERGVISCVGEPDWRFHEDALRILRALRFAAVYGFGIEEKTASSIHQNAALLNNIAAERVRAELEKLLCGKGALEILLDYSDVLAVIIPELSPCIGFEQHSRYHRYTVYEHMVRAAAGCGTQDPVVRMALLLHDVGKPLCFTRDENGGHFYGHSALSRELAETVLDRLRFDRRSRHDILELIQYHDMPLEPTAKAVRRWLNRLGPEQLSRLLAVFRGDALAQAEFLKEERLGRCQALAELMGEAVRAGACFSLKDLAVDGRDIMALGVPEGRRVGEVLRALLEEVIGGTLENEPDALKNRARSLL